ncbi:MAG: prepilin-type N-terminal cleavage/methylation domain-containing protein, partial [Acidobacteria bacterium]
MSEGRSQSGFTLLEIAIALGLLAGVLVALAQVILYAGLTTVAARRVAVASVAASEKLEQLRGLAWGVDEAGGQVQDLQSDVSGAFVTESGGIGLSLSPGDSLGRDVPGFV